MNSKVLIILIILVLIVLMLCLITKNPIKENFFDVCADSTATNCDTGDGCKLNDVTTKCEEQCLFEPGASVADLEIKCETLYEEASYICSIGA